LTYNIFNHPLSPVGKRALYAFLIIVVIMTVGTVGTKLLTGWPWIDSFYFMSMVATAEGPPNAPPTFWSKVFISVMAFVSIGALITTIGTIFGPYFGYLLNKGVRFAQMEAEKERAKKSTEVAEKEGSGGL
jgi:hypothetical protein